MGHPCSLQKGLRAMLLLSPKPQVIAFDNGERVILPVALIDGRLFLTETRNILDIVVDDEGSVSLALSRGNRLIKRRQRNVASTLIFIGDLLVEATIFEGLMYVNTEPSPLPYLDNNGELVVFPRGLTLEKRYELPPFAAGVLFICNEERFNAAKGMGRGEVVCPDWRLHSETAALRDRQDHPRLTRRLRTFQPSEIQQWY